MTDTGEIVDFGLGTRVRRNGRVYEVNGIGRSGDGKHLDCSFRLVEQPASDPLVGFGAAVNALVEATDEPAGVVMDRLAMALAHALEHLRAEVPNHHPARVQARKALDGWVDWSVSAGGHYGRTEASDD